MKNGRILVACALVASIAGSGIALASFPIGQTAAARDPLFRINTADGGAGTLNLYGTVWSDADNVRMGFLTANHVVAGTTVASIDFRGIGQAGTFNAVPSGQSLQRVGGEDLEFVGLSFTRAALGNANFAALTAVAPLTIAADAGGAHTFQEWGYGVTATPDTIAGTAYPYVYHTGTAAEQDGRLRTFTNQILINTARATALGGLTIRDLTWDVFGPQVLLLVGSGAPGDSGAGLSDLGGPATTINGILTGGTDRRFNAAGVQVFDNSYNRIAWRSALGNTDQGFGLGFTAALVTDLTNRDLGFIPTPGTLTIGLGTVLLAVRRRRA